MMQIFDNFKILYKDYTAIAYTPKSTNNQLTNLFSSNKIACIPYEDKLREDIKSTHKLETVHD